MTPLLASVVALSLGVASLVAADTPDKPKAKAESPKAPARFVSRVPDLHQFLVKKWYFDELYDVLFVRPAQWLGSFFWHRGDEKTIDRFGPNGVAVAIAGGSKLAARLQSGFIYSYAFVMLLGLAALVTWAMVAFK